MSWSCSLGAVTCTTSPSAPPWFWRLGGKEWLEVIRIRPPVVRRSSRHHDTREVRSALSVKRGKSSSTKRTESFATTPPESCPTPASFRNSKKSWEEISCCERPRQLNQTQCLPVFAAVSFANSVFPEP